MTEESKKTELLRTLSDAERDGQEMASRGREIVQQGQRMSDLARCNKEFIEFIPDDSFFAQKQWDNQLSAWQRLSANASAAKERLAETEPLVFAADSTAVSSVSIISSENVMSLPPNVQDSAWSVVEKFEQIIEQSDLVKEIEDEINRLRLTTPHKGSETALSLLVQAEQAFKTPSIHEVAPSAVLIPLREAINRVFADLLPKRPHQEKTKGDREKVRSICMQCRRDGVDDKQIDYLANEAEELKDILSQAKQDSLTREQVRERLNRGLLFLRVFLRTIKLSS